MAYRIVWSPKAIDDTDSIALYISRDSTSYAAAVVRKILNTARSLESFPFAGRVVPELDDTNIRERLVYSYRIIYRIEETTVTVAAVIHGKRLLDAGQLG
ncbi:MAG: plasmid stabilization system protein [Acidobacteria bacterium]|nr:plasmid stabilization system protein [Acidobacteriota bacterium]